MAKVWRNNQIMIDVIDNELTMLSISKKWEISPSRVRQIIYRKCRQADKELYFSGGVGGKFPSIKFLRKHFKGIAGVERKTIFN